MNRDLQHLLELEELVMQRETLTSTGVLHRQVDLNDIVVKMRKLRCQLPGLVLSEYDRLSRFFVDVVSVVGDGVCKGCQRDIPRRFANRIKQSSQMLHCPNCGRFLLAEENAPDFVTTG